MSKKIIIGFFVFAISIANMNAQRHELGLRFGSSSLVGDIGRTSYLLHKPIKPMSEFGLPVYAGVIYRMNFNPYQTLRFDVGYNQIQFDDRVAKEQYRRNRQMYGSNDVWEADVMFEYNFFPVNNEQKKGLVSPYIFGGIGAMLFDVSKATMAHDFYRDSDGVAIAPTSETDFFSTVGYDSERKATMYIPFGLGLKYKFNYNWAISAEAMFRYTFSDQLDYSELTDKDLQPTYNADILSPATGTSLLQTGVYYSTAKERENEFLKNRRVGDPNSNDWINSVTLGITYSFGRPPCYCD